MDSCTRHSHVHSAAIRSATRLCRLDTNEQLRELTAVIKTIIGIRHCIIVSTPRIPSSGDVSSPIPLGNFETDTLELLNSDAALRDVVLRDTPRVHWEIVASDMTTLPGMSMFLGRGLRQVYSFELFASNTERLVLLCLDDSPLPLAADALDICEHLVSIVANTLAVEVKLRAADERVEELQTALRSRVVIEQAKGVLAERMGVAPDSAFTQLRDSARRDRTSLQRAAELVVETLAVRRRTLAPPSVDSLPPRRADNTVGDGLAL